MLSFKADKSDKQRTKSNEEKALELLIEKADTLDLNVFHTVYQGYKETKDYTTILSSLIDLKIIGLLDILTRFDHSVAAKFMKN